MSKDSNSRANRTDKCDAIGEGEHNARQARRSRAGQQRSFQRRPLSTIANRLNPTKKTCGSITDGQNATERHRCAVSSLFTPSQKVFRMLGEVMDSSCCKAFSSAEYL